MLIEIDQLCNMTCVIHVDSKQDGLTIPGLRERE
jgi:hypothetical protein